MKKAIFLAVFFGCMGLIFGCFEPVIATEVVIASKTAEIVDSSAMQDLTVPKVKVDRMVALLESQKVKSWYPFNFMKFGISRAIEGGVGEHCGFVFVSFGCYVGGFFAPSSRFEWIWHDYPNAFSYGFFVYRRIGGNTDA
jgi:hypothetical protein